MNLNPQLFSRRPWSQDIAAGQTASFEPTADYFYVQSVVDAGGVAQTIQIDINKANHKTPIGAGQGGQGVPGRADIQSIEFTNNTGATVTVTVIFGNGQANFAGLVQIQSGTLDLSPASIATLAAAIINARSLRPSTVIVGDGTGGTVASPYVVSAAKAYWAYNNGPDAASFDFGGTTEELGASEEAEDSIENDSDTLTDFTVTVPAGTTCKIRMLKYA